jgi:hypothetical protein
MLIKKKNQKLVLLDFIQVHLIKVFFFFFLIFFKKKNIDIAFTIVNKEWEIVTRRGFKADFDNGKKKYFKKKKRYFIFIFLFQKICFSKNILINIYLFT